MHKWLLTTRSGFWCLAAQCAGTLGAQAYLWYTGGLSYAHLVVLVALAPLALRTLTSNWFLRHRFCMHCGHRAVHCWPVCSNAALGADA